MEEIFEEFTNNIAGEIPGFRSIAILNVHSADVLVSTNVKEINDEVVQENALLQLQTYLSSLRGIEKSYYNSVDTVKEVLITTENFFYIYDVSPDGGFIAVLVVDKQETNIGITRGVMKRHNETLGKQLDELNR